MKNMAYVDQDMTTHSECELCLALHGAFDGSDEESACIENCCERRKPALVVVLGTVVTEDGIGDVRLEHRRAPTLPLCEQFVQRCISAIEVVTQQEFACSRRRTRACVEQSYFHFTRRKGR